MLGLGVGFTSPAVLWGGGGGAAGAVGGAALLEGEADGFAADFTYSVDANRVAVKAGGTVTAHGISFITSSGTSSKWVYDATGLLVNVPVGTPALDHDPVTHASKGLLCEPQATNVLLNNATLSTQSVTVTATPYTLSFWGTGSVTLSGVSTAGPLVGTGANDRVSLTFTPSAGSLTLTVSGTVSRAQLETGSIATSPIPTAAASVTRAVDIYSVTAASINYSATAGSWWVEVSPNIYLPNGARILGSGVGGEVPIYQDATAFSMYIAGSVLAGPTVASSIGLNKIAVAFQSADRAITANGLAVSTDTNSAAILLAPGSVHLGAESGGTQMNGYFRKVYYLPRRMPNAEMQTETAP